MEDLFPRLVPGGPGEPGEVTRAGPSEVTRAALFFGSGAGEFHSRGLRSMLGRYAKPMFTFCSWRNGVTGEAVLLNELAFCNLLVVLGVSSRRRPFVVLDIKLNVLSISAQLYLWI